MNGIAIEKLTANVLETRFENSARATLDNTMNRIIDTIGCLTGKLINRFANHKISYSVT
jgi:hypothetical protein